METIRKIRLALGKGMSIREILSRYGLNLSGAVRMLFSRITVEEGLPAGLIMSKEEHDS